MLDEFVLLQAAPPVLPPSGMEMFRHIAKESAWLLDAANLQRSATELTTRFRSKVARALGGDGPKPNGHRLLSTIRAWAGDDAISFLEAAMDPGSPDRDWIVRLARKGSVLGISPVRFIIALGACHLRLKDLLDEDSSATTVWPPTSLNIARRGDAARREFCANRLCIAHGGDLDPVEIQRGDQTVSFVLDCRVCGFSLSFQATDPPKMKILETGEVWESALRKGIETKKVNLSALSRMLGFDVDTVRAEMVRLGLTLERWKSRQTPRARTAAAKRLVHIERHRKIWLGVRSDNPDLGPYELGLLVPSTMAYLRTNDLEWLREHKPPRKHRRGRRSPPSPEHKMDGDWARRAPEIVMKIISTPGIPNRVTKRKIEIALRGRALTPTERKRSPMLARCIAKLVDTDRSYGIRKLYWAIDQFKSSGTNLTEARIRKRIAVTDTVLRAIERDILAALAEEAAKAELPNTLVVNSISGKKRTTDANSVRW